MSVKNIWRDSSFRKFLIGGVVLIALVGVGLNVFKPKTVPVDNQETLPGGFETSDQPTKTVQGAEENVTPVETEVDQSEVSDALIDDSNALPHSGPADFWLPLGILSTLTYGATYFLQKR